jgi:acetyl-CoA/propionyl-CoA carboxylase
MQMALSDFYIEGVETSIPLYKTILDSNEFIKGDLSTNFLDRFKILDRLHDDMKSEILHNSEAALAAAVIHSEFLKSRVKSRTSHNIRWKNQLDRA